YNVHHIALYRYAFKTPTLRNVALTAPYMHNGVFNTLEEVLTFYNNGGGAGMGMQLQGQTLPTDSLHLNQQEQQDVIAFMQSLTDTAAIQ
ncbi:MAG TPA: cytochrome C peroxidase, partial [Chitinophaga sp.]